MSEVVFVSGSTGLLGSHVIKLLLDRGWRVKGTIRNPNKDIVNNLKSLSDNGEKNLELVELDITKEEGWKEALTGCAYVIHCANAEPKEEHDRTEEDKKVLYRVVYLGTKMLYELCIATNIKKFICASNILTVTGNGLIDGKTYSENDFVDVDKYPKELYGEYIGIKREYDLLKWHRNLPDSSKLQLVLPIACAFQGPLLLKGQIHAPPAQFIKALIVDKRIPVLIKHKINYTDVRDFAKAHVNAITAEIPPEISRIIIASNPVCLVEHAKIVKKILEERNINYKLPREVPVSIAKFIVNTVPLFKRLSAFVGKNVNLDTSKMNILKVEPINAESAIEDFIKSYLDFSDISKQLKMK